MLSMSCKLEQDAGLDRTYLSSSTRDAMASRCTQRVDEVSEAARLDFGSTT
jgi:hypothetical protein